MTSQFIFLMLTSSIRSSITAAELTHVGVAEASVPQLRGLLVVAAIYLALTSRLSSCSLIYRVSFAYPAGATMTMLFGPASSFPPQGRRLDARRFRDGFALGGLGGLGIALCRSSGLRWLRRWPCPSSRLSGARRCCSSSSSSSSAWAARLSAQPLDGGFVALMLHASAFLGEIWRGSIQAIPSRPDRGCDALGIHYRPHARRHPAASVENRGSRRRSGSWCSCERNLARRHHRLHRAVAHRDFAINIPPIRRC